MGHIILMWCQFAMCFRSCYNRDMKKNEAVTVETDETRKAIVDKIESKRKATGALDTKSRNLDTQIMTYENAIVNYREKLRKAEERLESFKESKQAVVVELADREEELDHMDEILVRYDKASAESKKMADKILERIKVVPDRLPGTTDGGFENDLEYKKAKTRQEYLSTVMSHALSDVRKIFVSRGVISDYNVKGRRGI